MNLPHGLAMTGSSASSTAGGRARAPGHGIPKRIIQTAKTADLSLLGQAAAANLKLLNPDFEYCFFDNSRVAAFMQDEFPQYLGVFNNFPQTIQRYDFFRYLAVYRLGGFYLDLDVFTARSLSTLLNLGCVFPFEELTLSGHLRKQHGIDWELGNYAFGAQAGHPFIKAVIDHCLRTQQDPRWAEPMIESIPRPFRGQFLAPITTGPGAVTRTLAENADLRPTVAILFPEDVCDDRTWHRFGDYGVHLMQASWRRSDGFIRQRLARSWESWKRGRLLSQSKRLGPQRPGEWKTIRCSEKNHPADVR